MRSEAVAPSKIGVILAADVVPAALNVDIRGPVNNIVAQEEGRRNRKEEDEKGERKNERELLPGSTSLAKDQPLIHFREADKETTSVRLNTGVKEAGIKNTLFEAAQNSTFVEAGKKADKETSRKSKHLQNKQSTKKVESETNKICFVMFVLKFSFCFVILSFSVFCILLFIAFPHLFVFCVLGFPF